MKQKKPTIYDCTIIELPRIYFRAGNITPIHENINVPFEIERIFYLYDIPGGEARGGHAHKKCHQFLVAASGSFDINVDDGVNKQVYSLNRPYFGLYIPPLIWSQQFNFSSGAICLVLASHKYIEEDYFRDYDNFKKFKNND